MQEYSFSNEMINESSHSKNNVSLLETSLPSNFYKNCKMILITAGHLEDNIQAENNEQSASNMKHISHDVSIHSGEKPHEYTQCSKKRIKLKNNLIIHSGDNYKCLHCGKRFSRNKHLNEHLRIHSGEKPYECTQCGKKFSQSGSLKRHKRIHSGEKPYECTQCGKKFSQSDALRMHKRVHSGEKPYECTQCGTRFTVNCSLKKHMLLHSGEKPYECTQCGQKFTNRSGLKYHMSKKRSCITTSSRSLLKRHIPAPSPDKLFECWQCSRQFNSTNHLIEHIRSHCGHLQSRRTHHLDGIAIKSPPGETITDFF